MNDMMLPETIKILAEDIRATSYSDPYDCAITRAIRRAGINGYDAVMIVATNVTNKVICGLNEEDYDLVLAMYAYGDPEMYDSIEPRDFDMRIIKYDDSSL
jgi:hypothetical protein